MCAATGLSFLDDRTSIGCALGLDFVGGKRREGLRLFDSLGVRSVRRRWSKCRIYIFKLTMLRIFRDSETCVKMFSDEGLVSCDTFVVMGDVTTTGELVFGKNSDRPRGEVQEVVYVEPGHYEPRTKLKAGGSTGL